MIWARMAGTASFHRSRRWVPCQIVPPAVPFRRIFRCFHESESFFRFLHLILFCHFSQEPSSQAFFPVNLLRPGDVSLIVQVALSCVKLLEYPCKSCREGAHSWTNHWKGSWPSGLPPGMTWRSPGSASTAIPRRTALLSPLTLNAAEAEDVCRRPALSPDPLAFLPAGAVPSPPGCAPWPATLPSTGTAAGCVGSKGKREPFFPRVRKTRRIACWSGMNCSRPSPACPISSACPCV